MNKIETRTKRKVAFYFVPFRSVYSTLRVRVRVRNCESRIVTDCWPWDDAAFSTTEGAVTALPLIRNEREIIATEWEQTKVNFLTKVDHAAALADSAAAVAAAGVAASAPISS